MRLRNMVLSPEREATDMTAETYPSRQDVRGRIPTVDINPIVDINIPFILILYNS